MKMKYGRFVSGDEHYPIAFGSDPFAHRKEGPVREHREYASVTPNKLQVNAAGGTVFRVPGLHLKSKGNFCAHESSSWWHRADANRRKNLAQIIQVGRPDHPGRVGNPQPLRDRCGEIRGRTPNGTSISDAYPHACDHYSVSAVVIHSVSLEGV